MKTYYEILGVSKNALKKDIKRAYRKLVKQFHPDVNKNGEKVFEEITRAYNTLNSPEKRRDYDLKLKEKHKSLPKLNFNFRELKRKLYSLRFIQAIFFSKKAAGSSKKIDRSILAMDVKELFERVLYSNNIHVQTHAVRAVIAKNKKYVVNDLLRLLYSNIREEVKVEIIEGIKKYNSQNIRSALEEIYDIEKSFKVKKMIRNAIKLTV